MVFVQSSGQLQTTTPGLWGGNPVSWRGFDPSINRLGIVIDDVIAIVVVRKLNVIR